MGEETAIGWTNATFNPWWGCTRVSPGCEHCYAETFAKRTGNDVWGKNNDRRFFGDKHWNEPLRWNKKAEAAGVRHRVFCASMADVFEDRRDLDAERARLWELIEATPWLDWQLLTKRPQNVLRLAADSWLSAWPSNAWVGTTVEDQQRADERIPELLAVPAPVRFLSCEPMLGPVDIERYLYLMGAGTTGPWSDGIGRWRTTDGRGRRLASGPGGQAVTSIPSSDVHWVICGGESGPKHRPLNVDHARSLRDQCEGAGVAFFFKQHGGRTPTAGGDLLDGVQHKEFPA